MLPTYLRTCGCVRWRTTSHVLKASKAQIQDIAALGTYDDVAPDYEAPAALSVATKDAIAELETAAPTPAPTPALAPASSASIPVGAVIGGAAAAAKRASTVDELRASPRDGRDGEGAGTIQTRCTSGRPG